ncbi:MAG: MATE family efflux transporter [Bergeyella sp.]|nr:MATE family efflux transporter [Bergeyella sp.]
MQFLDSELTKKTLTLAFPVMLTQLGQVSVQIFDNIIVGQLLGADALASVSLANAIFISFFVLALGMSLAIPPLVSEAHAQKNHQEINRIFSHGGVINLGVGFLLMMMMLIGLPLLNYTGQPEHVLPDTISYLRIMGISIIPFMLFQTLREFSEGLSYTLGVTKATIAGNILNIALNYIFIKGMFGIAPMGVDGAALATLISRIFMFVLLYFILKKHRVTRRYILDFSIKAKMFSGDLFGKMIKLGIPTALQIFFETSAFAAASFICGLISSQDIAAHQIALSVASSTFNISIGIGVASTVMVGNRLGKQDFIGLRNVGINNLKIIFLFMFFCGTVFIIGKNVIPLLFARPENTAVISLASRILIIAALFQLSDGIQVVAMGILRGMQDVKIPSFITFVIYWVFVLPLGYYLCYVRKMGSYGMWISLGIGLSISAVLLLRRFLVMSRLKPEEV